MSLFDRLTVAVKNKTESEINRKTASKTREFSALGKILRGDSAGLANQALDDVFARAGISGTRIFSRAGLSSANINGTQRATYHGGRDKPSKLLGGITLDEAKKIASKIINADYAKKNLFHVSVENLSTDNPIDFNMFLVDVSYGRINVSGDAIQIGSGSFDTVTNSERIEMRFTTFDDRDSSIKKWFDELHYRMCNRDGTFGLPIDYLTRITVTHGFITDDDRAYQDSYVMRPTSLEIDKSRRDDAMEELQITFTQFDTFTAL